MAAFAVSASNIDGVRQYIRDQEAHHQDRNFEDEFRTHLIKHGIEFNERYLFEEEHVV